MYDRAQTRYANGPYTQKVVISTPPARHSNRASYLLPKAWRQSQCRGVQAVRDNAASCVSNEQPTRAQSVTGAFAADPRHRGAATEVAMMNGHMDGWYSSMGSGGWVFGAIIAVAAILVIVAAIKYLRKA